MRGAWSAAIALPLGIGALEACSTTPPAEGTGTAETAATTGADPTGPAAVRYVGRTETRDPNGARLGWGGTDVIVRFEGTELAVKLAETAVNRGPSRYDVIVDGQLQTAPLAPPEGTSDNLLASGLAPGTHVVELWRRTEGMVATTQILGFNVGAGQLLAPPLAARRRIEFVGDSESAGYGIECTSASDAFSGATENEHKAFPALIAQNLAAEHSALAYSGKGVSRNHDDGNTETFAALYGRSLPDDAESAWSFTSWVPDVVFVALGTNDYSGAGARAAPDAATFKAKYHELVALVRSRNPNAEIVCAAEGALNDGYPAGWNAYTNVTTALKSVVAERNAAPIDDAKVHYYEFPRTDASGVDGAPDATGCDWHPNASYHERAAADASAKIRAIMGW